MAVQLTLLTELQPTPQSGTAERPIVIPTAGARMPSFDEPFMEHPTGEFANAVSAMEDAIGRLRALDSWDRWIAFCGQGQGSRPETYHVAEVRLRGDEIRTDKPQVDVPAILELSGLEADEIDVETDGTGGLTVRRVTPGQLARFLDGLFRSQLGVRRFDDDGDYTVGAEWCDAAR